MMLASVLGPLQGLLLGIWVCFVNSGLCFRALGLGIRVVGLGLRNNKVKGIGFRAWGLGLD